MPKPSFHWFYAIIAALPMGFYLYPSLIHEVIEKESYGGMIVFGVYVGFALVGLLGWKLNQTRILFVSLFFLAAYYTVNRVALGGEFLSLSRLWFDIIPLCLPLAIAIVFALGESRLGERNAAWRFFLGICPIALVYVLVIVFPEQSVAVIEWSPYPVPFVFVPALSLISIATLGVITTLVKDKNIRPFAQGSLFALLPVLTSTQVLKDPHFGSDNALAYSDVAYLTVPIIFLHVLFRMYWQRVYIDELTGIPNRRALDERLATLKGEYTIAMIDIDHFKKFNDRYGHDEGDNVLRLVAQTISKVSDCRAYRYGGEEFCALFDGFASEDSYMFANKMRRTLEKRVFMIRSESNIHTGLLSSRIRRKFLGQIPERDGGKKEKITISVGLASPLQPDSGYEEVMKQADQALYEAKRSGRNRVVVAGQKPKGKPKESKPRESKAQS